jgi:Archaeal fructose-1,6-bisphosphatase and related enzymes of inositol monophosphatase family
MVSIQGMSTFASALIVSMAQVSSLGVKIPHCRRAIKADAGSTCWFRSTTSSNAFISTNSRSRSGTFHPPCRRNHSSKVYQRKSSTIITATQLTDESRDGTTSNDDDSFHYYSSSTSSTTRDMQHVLATAERAAYQAGEIMKATFGKISISRTKVNDRDLVTESDVECQRMIKDIIRSEFPQDEFLGEEDVGVGSLASSEALKNAMENIFYKKKENEAVEMRESDGEEKQKMNSEENKLLWIVDPIDGTTNFQAGLCMFCVSIGVISLERIYKDDDANDDYEKHPVVVAGVIYNPILNELVSAVKGRGCYVNGEKLKSKTDPLPPHGSGGGGGYRLKNALINVGFPVSSDSALSASSRAVGALATKVRGLRMIASASQVMSWVAQGKLNAYISWDLNSWDVAAGMVIVEEAGGYVSNFDGTRADISSRDLIVTCSETGVESSSQQPPNSDRPMYVLNGEIRKILTEHDCLNY